MKRLLPELLAMWLLPLSVAAAPAPVPAPAGKTPIVVTADKADIRQKDGVGIYQGHAELTQGQRHMSADIIRIQVNKKGRLQKVEATGSPVKLNEGKSLRAHAGRMVYDVAGGQLYLYDNAFVFHEGRTFEGAKVQYDLKSKEVRASGGGKGGGRVKLVIPPEQKTAPKPAPKTSEPEKSGQQEKPATP